MSYSNLVEDLLDFDFQDEPARGWLAVVDEVHTLSAGDLRSLSQYAPHQLFQVDLAPTGLKFDEKMAKWFFAATRAWRESYDVTLDELRSVMPPGVVSSRAERVAVWEPIMRAFNRNVVKVSTAGSLLLTAVTGSGVQQYLTCIDLEKRLFACSCPIYNHEDETERKRHILCKHLMLSIYHHNQLILEESGDSRDWSSSLKAAQNHPRSDVMIPNWLYYFIKKVFAKMGFEAGLFKDPNQVEEVLILMKEG
ncbi:hypothetical protein B6U84_00075 [Candidatus Bathyarchaeota archaeon ex4484_40]|nr:MAG: hypothetical protein B6U84_00075 [Candidatus Bathyarchaeota archaeon ex4484_40]